MDIVLKRILSCMGKGHGEAKKLADSIGINPQIITNWKCGKSKSYTKYLHEIAKYYGVSVDYLLGNEEKPLVNDDKELTEYLEELKNRSELRMLFSLTKGATKQDVEKAVKIIETLLGK